MERDPRLKVDSFLYLTPILNFLITFTTYNVQTIEIIVRLVVVKGVCTSGHILLMLTRRNLKYFEIY